MYSSRCFKVKKLPLQQVDIKKQGLKTRKRDVIIYAPLARTNKNFKNNLMVREINKRSLSN